MLPTVVFSISLSTYNIYSFIRNFQNVYRKDHYL